MTVTASETRLSYAGNGTTTVFSFPYKFFLDADLQVYLVDASGVGTLKALGSDYTVSGARNDSGGFVTFTAAPASGYTVVLINQPQIIQDKNYVNADDFPAESHEEALDRLTKIAQRLSDRIDRTVRVADYATLTGLPTAADLTTLVASATTAAASATAAKTAIDADTATVTSLATQVSSNASAAAASASAAAASASASVTAHITWRGNWNSGTAYVANDAVQSGGSSYICILGHTNQVPPNATYWNTLAQQGSAGAGTGDMLKANNLSELTNFTTARSNLGLGGAAVLNVGTAASTVAAGDDSRITGAVQTSRNVNTSGLATGGGNLSADRTINVPKAAGTDVTTGTDDTKAVTSKALADAGVLAAWTTGDVKLTLKTTADTGWIMANDGTIGDASSGATTRANADTSALYTLLWNNVSDTYATVTGGRGASAAADFAAHKPLAITKMLGRALALAGAGSGLTSRVLGQTLGEENHALTAAENGPHTHSYNDTQPDQFSSTTVEGVLDTTTVTLHVTPTDVSRTTGSSGSGTAHNNMQPTSFLNAMIKL